MEKKIITVSADTFRSALVPAAAALCALSGLLGLSAALSLLQPQSVAVLTEDLLLGGVSDPNALKTWQLIHIVLTVVTGICPLWLAFCLIRTIRGNVGKGMDLIHDGAQLLLRLVNISAACALAVLIFRVLIYTFSVLQKNEGPYYLYSMVISEALMVVQAWYLYTQLRKFLNCVCDSALSIGCTLTTGHLDNISIPGFTANGFLILAIFCLAVGLDRLFTLTVVTNIYGSYYKLLIADQPVLYLSGAALLLSAGSNVLLCLYLRQYKRISERLLYAPLREK